MLRGLAGDGFVADDVAAAARWYADLLGIEPYFLRPDAENRAYVESGWVTTSTSSASSTAATTSLDRPGVGVDWHVNDIDAALRARGHRASSQPHPPRHGAWAASRSRIRQREGRHQMSADPPRRWRPKSR